MEEFKLPQREDKFPELKVGYYTELSCTKVYHKQNWFERLFGFQKDVKGFNFKYRIILGTPGEGPDLPKGLLRVGEILSIGESSSQWYVEKLLGSNTYDITNTNLIQPFFGSGIIFDAPIHKLFSTVGEP